MTAAPTTEPIATPAMAPFDKVPFLVVVGVDEAVILAVGAEVEAAVEAGVEVELGDGAGVAEAVDEVLVVCYLLSIFSPIKIRGMDCTVASTIMTGS